jgi:hypothetical protein
MAKLVNALADGRPASAASSLIINGPLNGNLMPNVVIDDSPLDALGRLRVTPWTTSTITQIILATEEPRPTLNAVKHNSKTSFCEDVTAQQADFPPATYPFVSRRNPLGPWAITVFTRLCKGALIPIKYNYCSNVQSRRFAPI